MKTPAEVAREQLDSVSTEDYFNRSITDWMIAAIEADRAQRDVTLEHLVKAWDETIEEVHANGDDTLVAFARRLGIQVQA